MTLSFATVAALGVLVVVAPLIAMPLVAFIASAKLRLGWFVVGGMLVFQQSDSVGGPKLIYLAGAALVTALSMVRVGQSDAPWLHVFRPVIPATVALIALLATSFLVATSGETTSMNWIRDAFPYLLLTMAPIIALDAAHEISETSIARLIALCGVLAAIGFAADWLERRGVSSLPFGRVLLGSGCLAALGMSMALAKVAAGQHAVRWASTGVIIPAVMITSGARSIVAFGAALIGAIGSRRNGRIGPGRAILIAVTVGGALFVLVPRLVAVAVDDPAWFDSRVRSAVTVLNGDGQADLSYGQRSLAYEYAAEAWRTHTWFGTGPGHTYATGAFTLDTPLLTVAKFGLIGTAILVIFLWTLLACCLRTGRRFGIRPAHTTIRALTCVMVAFLPFGTPVEDKGFAFAIALVVTAIGAASARGFEDLVNQQDADAHPGQMPSIDRKSSSPAAAGSAK